MFIVLIAIAGGAAYWFRSTPDFASPIISTEEPKDLELALIEDEWGLRLFYPKGFMATAATEAGELTRYTITDQNKQGHLAVYSKETTAKTAEEWVLDDEEAESSGSLDTEVGGVTGKKIRFTDPVRTQIVVVDAGQVFLFESQPKEGEEQFWEDALATVVEKFEFLPFEGEEEIVYDNAPAAPAADSGGDVIVEEEVVE